MIEILPGSRSVSTQRAVQQPGKPAVLRAGGVAAGTRLLTPDGYQPIETLRRGDQVATLIGRGPLFVPIVWVGRRRETLSGRTKNESDPPVRIRRHAIGTDMPNCDLLLAPDHAIYINGVLYRSDALVNEASITRERSTRTVEYWCVQLERHNILVAENLAIESILCTSAFAEVTAPRLAVADAAPPQTDRETATEPVEFPARIQWSIRWFRRRLLARGQTAPEAASQPRPAQRVLSDTASLLDVDTEGRAALAGLADLAAQSRVRLSIAVQPDLLVHIAPRTFHEALDILLVHAIEATPGGKVLLGAMRHGGRVQIAVVDDGQGTSAERQRADLRRVAEIVALIGGSVEIDSRPGEGTTILLRLPDARPFR